MHCDQDRESSDGNTDAEDRERHAHSRVVGQCRYQHCEAKSGSPWWDGVELRFNRAVPIPLDDARTRTKFISLGAVGQTFILEATCLKYAYPYAGTIRPKYINPATRTL